MPGWCAVDGHEISTGRGRNKKLARREAAKHALQQLASRDAALLAEYRGSRTELCGASPRDGQPAAAVTDGLAVQQKGNMGLPGDRDSSEVVGLHSRYCGRLDPRMYHSSTRTPEQ